MAGFEYMKGDGTAWPGVGAGARGEGQCMEGAACMEDLI